MHDRRFILSQWNFILFYNLTSLKKKLINWKHLRFCTLKSLLKDRGTLLCFFEFLHFALWVKIHNFGTFFSEKSWLRFGINVILVNLKDVNLLLHLMVRMILLMAYHAIVSYCHWHSGGLLNISGNCRDPAKKCNFKAAQLYAYLWLYVFCIKCYVENYSEDALTLHEHQVEVMRNYYEENSAIFKLVEKRENLWKKFIEFEVLYLFKSFRNLCTFFTKCTCCSIDGNDKVWHSCSHLFSAKCLEVYFGLLFILTLNAYPFNFFINLVISCRVRKTIQIGCFYIVEVLYLKKWNHEIVCKKVYQR